MITKKRFCSVLIVCVVAIIAAGVFWYTNRNVKTITPTKEIMSENIVHFYQKDELWKDDRLGDSKYHMSDSGCLTTCIASQILMQNISVEDLQEVTPKTLNGLFSDNGVYDSEGNIQWTAAGEVLDVEFVLKDASDVSVEELETLIERGIYPVVRVKMKSSGNFHFVLLVGCDNHEFQCTDPLNEDSEIISLSEFDNKIYSVRYIDM